MRNRSIVILLCVVFCVACAAETNLPATTPLPEQTTPPQSGTGPVFLFARDDDLWRMDVQAERVERLTEDGLLNWGVTKSPDWQMAVAYRPPQVSPDGRWISLSRTGRDLVLVNVETKKWEQIPELGAPLVAWSPDSRYMAYQGHEAFLMLRRQNDDLYVYDLQEQEASLLVSYDKDACCTIASLVWSPEGTQIGYGCCFETDEATGISTGLIQQLEFSTGKITTTGQIKSSIGGGTQPLCWTQDGKLTTDAAPGEAIRCSTPPPTGNISPDGTLAASLASASSDGHGQGTSVVMITDTNSGEVVRELELGITATKVIWSLDGRYLLLDDREPNSPIWRINVDGTVATEEIVSDGYLLNRITAWD